MWIIYSHTKMSSFHEPLTWKTEALLCYCRCLGKEHPHWRRRGASGTSYNQQLVHGAGGPVDVSEFLKIAGAFCVGLLWHLLVLFGYYSSILELFFRSESLMCWPWLCKYLSDNLKYRLVYKATNFCPSISVIISNCRFK